MRDVNWLRVARDAAVLAGIGFAVVTWWTFTSSGSAVDAHYYWAADPHHLYPHPELAEQNGYNYSPAFELVVGWGRLLPFEVFAGIWRAGLLVALVYLAGPFTLPVLLLWPVTSEINAANIQVLLALAVVTGFRRPGAWSFVLLTKVTPGVGLLWFAVRKEWRKLGLALGVTLAIAAVSMLFWADQWPDYLRLVTSGKAPSVAPWYLPLWVRLPPAIAITIVAGLTGKRWPVVVAATLALPVFYTISPSMLVGVLPFAREALGRELAKHGWSLERRKAPA
jgi:hypothetical protein